LIEIALSFMFFWVTMARVGHLAQWSLWQLVLILAATSLVRSIAELLFTNVCALPDKIRTGALDTFLVKPVNPLFHLIAERVKIRVWGWC
jgi:ABC-2 type transport system permease protein